MAGINSFGLDLVAESFLKSPAALTLSQKLGGALSFVYPIHRSDCPGYVGVHVSLEPIAEGDSGQLTAGTYELGEGYQLVLEVHDKPGSAMAVPAGTVLAPVMSAAVQRSGFFFIAGDTSSAGFETALLKLVVERKKLLAASLPVSVLNVLATFASRAAREAVLSLAKPEKGEAL